RIMNGNTWPNGGALRRRLDDPHDVFSLVQYVTDGSTPPIAEHISLRNGDETFFVGSTYDWSLNSLPFDNEIYLGYTNIGIVEGYSGGANRTNLGFVRLGPTHSQGTYDSYFSQPKATVDRLGRYIVYSSDYGSSSHMDAYLMKVPYGP